MSQRTAVDPDRPWRVLGAVLLGLSFGLFGFGVGGPLPARAQDEFFVTNETDESVTVHVRTDTGNTTPLRTLKGANTRLTRAWGVAVDPVNDELLVTNVRDNSVTVYARTASGNSPPLRTLQGPDTGLTSPYNLVVDPANNELLVTNLGGANSITVYARTASGNSPPLRTLQGINTGLVAPSLALDPVHNEVFAANPGPNSVTVHTRTASGNTGPLRTLQLGFAPSAVAVDSMNNELLVVTTADRVAVFPRAASGNTPPLRTLQVQGGAAGFNGAWGIAVDPVNDELLVVNQLADSVTVYARTASGNTPPLRTLHGAATGLGRPAAVAIPRKVPELDLLLNQASFTPGSTFAASLNVVNLSPAITVDVYFGSLLPPAAGSAVGCAAEDAVAFVSAAGGVAYTCRSASPATFPPFAQNVTVHAALPLTTVRDLFSFVWPANASAGTYVVFIAFTRPGTLDIVTLAHVSATFAP